jgi:hypothetical protein
MNRRIIIFLLIFIIGTFAGIFGYLNAKIATFEECEKAGWLVRRITVYDGITASLPGIEKKCELWSGKSFIKLGEVQLDSEQRRAVGIAVAPISYTVTVLEVNKLECQGCFSIRFQRNDNQNQFTITLNDWKIINYSQTQSIIYQNTLYGFSFSLPENWKGYSIVTSTWEGYIIGSKGDTPIEQGPLILIRHPEWTSQNPRQDIPIMVFTLTQWNSLLRGNFHIGAAPINPSRLGFNANYVFALPARYNFAFPMGYEEVEKILESNPLQPLQPLNTISTEEKILLCGGIPDRSTQNIVETTRLFINLPRDAYPNKEHNLQFKTISGDMTAGWISNAGPYGEAFESNSDCWSYYYEFDGNGEIDLTVENAIKSIPDYFVRFVVGSTQQPPKH